MGTYCMSCKNKECVNHNKSIYFEWDCKKYINNAYTNADHIREMNDKELAEFLMSEWFGDRICFYCEGEYEKCGDFKYCESKILEWLSKENK